MDYRAKQRARLKAISRQKKFMKGLPSETELDVCRDYTSGMPVDQIAKEHGFPLATVFTMLFRERKRNMYA